MSALWPLRPPVVGIELDTPLHGAGISTSVVTTCSRRVRSSPLTHSVRRTSLAQEPGDLRRARARRTTRLPRASPGPPHPESAGRSSCTTKPSRRRRSRAPWPLRRRCRACRRSRRRRGRRRHSTRIRCSAQGLDRGPDLLDPVLGLLDEPSDTAGVVRHLDQVVRHPALLG